MVRVLTFDEAVREDFDVALAEFRAHVLDPATSQGAMVEQISLLFQSVAYVRAKLLGYDPMAAA
jgi:hypothetical protein